MYKNKFIVVIKNKGKVLREFSGNVVKLPFGSDYSIALKNKNSVKVLVEVFVDGKDVLDGNSIIVDSNQTTELKGFMRGSTVKNKFRFIEKTDEISKFRGDLIEDGLIEVKYSFEKPVFRNSWVSYHAPLTEYYGGSTDMFGPPSSYQVSSYVPSRSYQVRSCARDVNESGITVPGVETRQDFQEGIIGVTGLQTSIIINLKGETKSTSKTKRKRVKRPITVKAKICCPTCGRRWKSSMKYCGNCSTYLH
jgi:hypothetical protein